METGDDTAPTLVLERVSKCYLTYRHELSRFATWFGMPQTPAREHWVLRDVDFALLPGEALGVIGGNGAGKSTLLKMVSGTVRPTTGRIAVNGTTATILELGLSFHPDLTGRENVLLYAAMLGAPPAQIEALEPAIREFADIGDAYDEPMRTYSTGMQARVAFSVATARRPDLLVIDEILSVGDGQFQAKSFNRILEYRAAGTAILFVTHGIEGVEVICDRALWLEHGRTALDGPSREVCRAYRAAIDAASPPDGRPGV
jgi:lipopolysaccharide transport system ATP-binding protein